MAPSLPRPCFHCLCQSCNVLLCLQRKVDLIACLSKVFASDVLHTCAVAACVLDHLAVVLQRLATCARYRDVLVPNAASAATLVNDNTRTQPQPQLVSRAVFVANTASCMELVARLARA